MLIARFLSYSVSSTSLYSNLGVSLVYFNRHYSCVYTHGATAYDVNVQTLRTALSVRYSSMCSARIIGFRKWTDPVMFNKGPKLIHTLDAGLLTRSQYPEGPATGHLGTDFSWFPCV